MMIHNLWSVIIHSVEFIVSSNVKFLNNFHIVFQVVQKDNIENIENIENIDNIDNIDNIHETWK